MRIKVTVKRYKVDGTKMKKRNLKENGGWEGDTQSEGCLVSC